jgi:hypothetical protein
MPCNAEEAKDEEEEEEEEEDAAIGREEKPSTVLIGSVNAARCGTTSAVAAEAAPQQFGTRNGR